MLMVLFSWLSLLLYDVFILLPVDEFATHILHSLQSAAFLSTVNDVDITVGEHIIFQNRCLGETGDELTLT